MPGDIEGLMDAINEVRLNVWNWKGLVRPPKYEVRTALRARPENVKERIVREREFENILLRSEQVAEFEYRPTKCRGTYRVVALRKNLSVEKGERRLFDDVRYFFYITNDRPLAPEAPVREAVGASDGVQEVREHVYASAMPDRADGASDRVPGAGVEPVAGGSVAWGGRAASPGGRRAWPSDALLTRTPRRRGTDAPIRSGKGRGRKDVKE